MQIKNIATGDTGFHGDFFPNVSFPNNTPSAEWLAENGYAEVLPEPPQPYVPTYADKRRMEYPPMQDYIDGIVKGDQAQVQTYIDACLAVKAKYPKP